MKKLSLVLFTMILTLVMGQAQDFNPFVQNATITPKPLLPLEFNGSGELYFDVGNTGVDDLPLVTNQEMTIVITLSNGVPNDVDPINALGGTAVNWFNWSYNAVTKTYTASQNQLIAGSSNGNVTIQYAVDRNTASASPSNGFNVNLQPPPYSNSSNSTLDDAASDYTYTEAIDYGDAPLSYGEAQHYINLVLSNGSYNQYVYLGSEVDQEDSYQDSADARGDDNNGSDDEDGISSFPTMIQGTQVTIPIQLSSEDNSQGFLRAWIDWNADGDFSDANETVITIYPFTSSSLYDFNLTIPADAVPGLTFARFRVGSFSGSSPTGSDSYGEVEDYQLEIIEAAPSLEVIKNQIAAGDAVNELIDYEIVVTNTGNVPIINIDVSDANATITSGNPISSLAPGESASVFAQHLISQDDIDAGYVANTAIATGDSPAGTDDVSDISDTGTDTNGDSITDPETVETPNSLNPLDINGDPTDDPTVTPLTQTPSIVLTKTGTLDMTIVLPDNRVDAGDVIDYSFEVTNTGNVTLYDVVLTDGDLTTGPSSLTGLTDEDNDGTADDLAVGAIASATGSYTVTQADIDAGTYTNVADVAGDDPNGIEQTDTDDDTQLLPRTPEIVLQKSGTLNDGGDGHDAGDVIDYTFTVTNTGNTTLYNVVLSDPDLTVGPSALTGLTDEDNDGTADDLAVGALASGTGSYTLTQDDIDAGSYYNQAVVDADSPTTSVQDDDDDTQQFTQTPSIVLTKTGTLDMTVVLPDNRVDVADVIDYAFTVTNNGNVTLYNVVLSDPDLTVGPSTLTGLTDEDNDGTADDLAVGAIASATGSYTVTQADIDAGTYTNVADVAGDDPNGIEQTDTDDDTQLLPRTPEIVLQKSGTLNDGGDGHDAGDVIDYAFTVTNNGNTTLYNVVLSDPDLTVGPSALTGLTDEDNDGTADDLAVGALASGTGSYTLTQDDIDAGSYYNQAVVDADSPTTSVQDDDDDTQQFTQTPSIVLTKTGTLDMTVVLPDNRVDVADVIDYAFTVTNNGNVTLYNVVLSDPDLTVGPSTLTGLTDEDNDGTADDLAVGAIASATGSYTVTQADIDAGTYTNVADVAGDDPNGIEQTDTDDDTQLLPRTPEIVLQKSGTLNDGGDGHDAGDVIDYTFTVTNTGNTTLYNVVLSDPDLTVGPSTLTGLTDEDNDGTADDLAVGAIASATGSYTLTQADIDAGTYTNVADVAGDDPNGNPQTDTDDDTKTLSRTPSIELDKTGTLDMTVVLPNNRADAGDEIDYDFTVTNTGNTTLYNVVLSDPDLTVGPSTLTGLTDEDNDGTADDLAVGASATATGTYTLTQDDIDAGSYYNQAVVDADSPTTSVQDDDDDTQTFTRIPELQVTKNETGRSYIVGEYITYDIIVVNTGNVTINNIDVVDANADILSGNPVGTLLPGASATLTAQHQVTQADIDAGFIANTAIATGDSPTGTDDVSDVSDTGTDSDGQTIPNNELVETPNTLNPGAVDGDSTNDPTVTPIAPPDLTPVITASPNVMHGETNFNIFVEVTELNLVNTSTGITVKIPSDIRWSLDGSFDQGLIVLDGIPLNNADWTYQGIISNEHVFTSSAIIPAGGFSMIGFEAIWNGGASQGVYTLTSQVLEGSGGENRIDNNVDAERVDYFIN